MNMTKGRLIGEQGQGLVEYGMIIALMAIAVIGAFVVLGPQIENMFAASTTEGAVGQGQAAISSMVYRAAPTVSFSFSGGTSTDAIGTLVDVTVTATPPGTATITSFDVTTSGSYGGGISSPSSTTRHVHYHVGGTLTIYASATASDGSSASQSQDY
jgi:pilus assembly protein Flp/PilA